MCVGLVNTVRAGEPARTQSPNPGLLAQADRPQGNTEQNNQTDQNNQNNMTGTSSSNETGRPSRFDRASQLIGMEVQNPQGQNLGDIKDVVIDRQKGTVSYVVLDSGGVWGMGGKMLAVPLSAFTISPDNKHLVLQASKENISKAEGIGNHWPSAENPSFGAMPFWQQNGNENNSNQGSSPNQ